jgi:hypothetical protein
MRARAVVHRLSVFSAICTAIWSPGPSNVFARAGHLCERASIGGRLGAHQMPVLAVPYLIIGIGAQPPVPAAPWGHAGISTRRRR